MSSTIENIAKNKVKLTIEVDAQTFEKGLDSAYKKTAKNYSAAGFRKGRAPRKVIESHYGEGIFYEDAFTELMPVAYQAAVIEQGIEPVERPDITIENMGHGQNMIFIAEVHVKPEVILGDYKGIEVEKVEYTLDEAEVQAKVDEAKNQGARYVDVDREVQLGDRTILDYKGSIDGEEFQGGSAENASLDIGAGMFIKGFEEQLVGAKKEEAKSITVTFPEDYPAEDYAGKEAVFEVVIHEIKEKQLPEFDDEFVKEISDEFDTTDEFLEDIRKKLIEEGEKKAKISTEEAAMKKVVEAAEVEIPDCMVQEQLDSMLSEMEANLSGGGMKLADFFQYTGTTVEQYRERNAGEAMSRVRNRLVIEAIRDAEGLKADDAELDEKLAEIAKNYNMEKEEFEKKIQSSEREYVCDTISLNKTIEMIMENAVLVDAKEVVKEEK